MRVENRIKKKKKKGGEKIEGMELFIHSVEDSFANDFHIERFASHNTLL